MVRTTARRQGPWRSRAFSVSEPLVAAEWANAPVERQPNVDLCGIIAGALNIIRASAQFRSIDLGHAVIEPFSSDDRPTKNEDLRRG